jgi:hypothetical protein
MAAMFAAPEYYDLLMGDVQNLYPERLLWAGEREQMLFEYPEEADGAEAHGVLFRLRYAAYRRLTSTLKADKPLKNVDAYVARETAIAQALLESTEPEPEDAYLASAPKRSLRGEAEEIDVERMLLLLIERVIDRTVETDTNGEHPAVFARTAYVDDRSLNGPRARPPFDMDTWHAVCSAGGWPRFMAIWLNYTVAPHGPMHAEARAARTFRTRHLVDAVGAWLALATTGRGCREVLAGTALCKGAWAALALPVALLWTH